jgi:dTDP-glucose 4,6-dehydratase
VHAICATLARERPGRDYAALVTHVKDRPGHDRRYAIDPSRIETELGWRAQESFETGLRKTVRWYLDNRAWWTPIREGVYGGERLGLAPA